MSMPAFPCFSRRGLFVLLLLGSLVTIWGEPLLETQSSATADFSSLVASGPSILLWSDRREATDLVDAWVASLEAAGKPPLIIRSADLSALPFFVPRWTVKMMLSKTYKDVPFYLDFSAGLKARYGLPSNGVVALALGPGGQLRTRIVGAASASGAATLLSALR